MGLDLYRGLSVPVQGVYARAWDEMLHLVIGHQGIAGELTRSILGTRQYADLKASR